LAGKNDRRRVLSRRSRIKHGGQERQTLIRADFGNHLSPAFTLAGSGSEAYDKTWMFDHLYSSI